MQFVKEEECKLSSRSIKTNKRGNTAEKVPEPSGPSGLESGSHGNRTGRGKGTTINRLRFFGTLDIPPGFERVIL